MRITLNYFNLHYKKIVDYNKKLVKYLETPELKGYDILLDEYEEGFSTKEYDAFFNKLREEFSSFCFKEVTARKQKFSFRKT